MKRVSPGRQAAFSASVTKVRADCTFVCKGKAACTFFLPSCAWLVERGTCLVEQPGPVCLLYYATTAALVARSPEEKLDAALPGWASSCALVNTGFCMAGHMQKQNKRWATGRRGSEQQQGSQASRRREGRPCLFQPTAILRPAPHRL
jgi:hypothetical protein